VGLFGFKNRRQCQSAGGEHAEEGKPVAHSEGACRCGIVVETWSY
jgi:hypothetical protein